MKHLLALLLMGLVLSQCLPDKALNPTTKINFDQRMIELMRELEPTLVGQWKLRQVRIKHQTGNYRQKELNITKDTAFVDFATLTITPAAQARSIPKDLRRGEYDGIIEYAGKSYPIQFNLLAGAEWIVSQKGPQGFFLLDYRFPPGIRYTETEEEFLEDLGLIGDNFSLEVGAQQRTMVWRGLNRGVDFIELVKK